MNRLFFLILLLPFVLLSQSQNKYPTLLWKISGKGMKKPSYLYGTMHVSNRVAYYLSEQFFDALKSVDVVGLETNPGEWLSNMEKTGELDEISRLNYSYNYRGEFYKNAFALNFPEKRMLQGILSYDPDIIDGLLYRETRSNANFEESTYIDLFIYQSAAKLNKQLISLENFEQSEIKARLSSVPDPVNDEDEGTRSVNAYAQKIEDAYRDGNLDVLDSLSKLVSSKNTQRFLINDRNEFFVKTIDSVLQTKSLFSGVGAAHLPGEKGVIELLRAKGYKVEPVYPKVSKKSNQLRESLDLKVKPVTFSTHSLSDSLFTCSAPGKLYPIVNVGNLRYYIHADMANGSFYTIVRLKHLGPLFGDTPTDLMKRVDSLLFENIPGKILLKRDIQSNTGLKGIEIVNRTRNGNEQHYQIYFSDLELIIFKLGGKHSYATGNEAKQFFSSIRFETKPLKSINFSPITKGFEVSIPSNYTYAKSAGGTLIGKVEDVYAFDNQSKVFYGVQHAVYNDFTYLEEDTFELNQFKKQILLQFKYDSVLTSELKHEQGFPTIHFKAKNKRGNEMEAKVLIKGVHYYFVFRVSEKEQITNVFFDSFKLSKFKYINPIKEITDKGFLFKVKDEVTDDALSKFNDLYAKAYAKEIPKEDEKKNDFDYRIDSKYYYSPSSNEYVSITLEKYNDYDYRDTNKLEERITKNLNANGSISIKNQHKIFSEGKFTYTCTLNDTATCRAIALKLFVKNGLMHEILAPFDTTIGLRGWTKGFFDSFEPLDTLIGKNIFENKFGQLLTDLSSSDTVVRKRANTSLLSIGVQTAYATQFVNFISSPEINKVNEDSRAQLFVNGGTLETEKIISPYKYLYKNYTDSFYLQLCLLKGLAYLKTQTAYTEFYNLLMAEPPLVGAENTISDVFLVLHDSLELCTKFFPGMLALTKYDEYRDAVYALLADLVHENLILPAVYSAQKETILTDANLALKRYTPQSNRIKSEKNENDFDHLDKTSQEIAINIRRSLLALSTNNRYRGKKYLKTLNTYDRSPLVNYLWIVAPFYKTDEHVKLFYTKLTKVKAQNIAMPLCVQELKLKVNSNDTMNDYYSKNKFTRTYYYSELEKEKLITKFNKQYHSQKSLIESVIQSQTQLNSYYNYEKENLKKDSLAFIKTVEASNKYQTGKLYVYKNAKSKNEDETWSIAFVDESKGSPTSNIELVHSEYFIDKSLSEEENLRELVYYFSLSYRNRAQLISNAYSN